MAIARERRLLELGGGARLVERADGGSKLEDEALNDSDDEEEEEKSSVVGSCGLL